jgi:hypothetical protein
MEGWWLKGVGCARVRPSTEIMLPSSIFDPYGAGARGVLTGGVLEAGDRWWWQGLGCAGMRFATEVVLPSCVADPHGAGACGVLTGGGWDGGRCEGAACGTRRNAAVVVEEVLDQSGLYCFRVKGGRGNEAGFSKTHRWPSVPFGGVDVVDGVYAQPVDFISPYYT